MSADRAMRLSEIGAVLAERRPNVLSAVIVMLESMLAAIDAELRIERASTAPVTLTAEHVLEAARARGVPAFGGGGGGRLILLASLGLDLTRPEVRAALLDLHRHGAIQLVPVNMPDLARADLAHRGHRPASSMRSAVLSCTRSLGPAAPADVIASSTVEASPGEVIEATRRSTRTSHGGSQ